MSGSAGEHDAGQASTQDAAPIQSALTLVMPIESAEAARQLVQALQLVQRLPRSENPIMVALDKLGTVHFARFALLENDTRLAVITEYDGDFETYVNDFINEIGDVFNALLAFMADPPPLPVQTHRREFLEYVRAHDMGAVPPLYSAYPTATVLDIQDALAARVP